jgi:hypothetical protein
VGRAALVVKAADMLDNSHYLDPCLDEAFCKSWVEEMRYLLEVSRLILMHEVIWEKLAQRCEEMIGDYG